jgi:hypothetical protein
MITMVKAIVAAMGEVGAVVELGTCTVEVAETGTSVVVTPIIIIIRT